MNGGFSLEIVGNEKTFVASYLGMTTQEIRLNNSDYYNIKLSTDAKLLDEVFVTGYQTISKQRTTGSFSTVNQKAVKTNLRPQILDRLEGKVAGLVKEGNEYVLRGLSTFRGGSQPFDSGRWNAVSK